MAAEVEWWAAQSREDFAAAVDAQTQHAPGARDPALAASSAPVPLSALGIISRVLHISFGTN